MVQVPEWLFGPAGDLRPLPNPTPGVNATMERFGGTHVAISGSRTVDTFGYKMSYDFTLGNLYPEEVSRLEVLATSTGSSNMYLLDPMRPNMLARQYSTGMRTNANNCTRGYTPTTDPNSVPNPWVPGYVVMSTLSNTADAFISSPSTPFPLNNTPVTVSAFYATSTTGLQIYHNVQFFDAAGMSLGTQSGSLLTVPTSGWTRLSSTLTPPAGAVVGYARFAVASQGESYASAVSVNVAGMQVNMGSTLARTSIGGGAIRCFVDTFDIDSPRYPLQNISLSLVEV